MPAPANVANGLDARQSLGQPALDPRLVRRHLRQKPFTRDDGLYRDPRCAASGMAGESMACAKGPIHCADRIPHRRRADRSAQGHVAARQTLGDRHDVRLYPVTFQRAPRPGTARAAHYLIRNHQHAIFRANLADKAGIAVWRWHTATCCTDNGFEDKGRDGFRPRL